MIKLLKFGLIGILNTSITIGSYAVFVYIFNMNFIIANIIAYILGMINSYFWNKNWVFEVKESNTFTYVKFIVVNVGMLGFNSLGLYILVSNFHINKMISQIIIVGASMFLNFILTKTWTFRSNKSVA